METSSDLLECVLALLTDTENSSDLGECALALLADTETSSDWALPLLTDTGKTELLVDTETSSGLEE